jgi:hypothetical protein
MTFASSFDNDLVTDPEIKNFSFYPDKKFQFLAKRNPRPKLAGFDLTGASL